MEELLTLNALAAFVTLTILEIILGIDNVVVVAIVADRLEESLRAKARFIGLSLAMVMRIALLFAITWLTRLEGGLFTLFEHEYSGRDLIMLVGGVFLIAKATKELHASVEGEAHASGKAAPSFGAAIVTIVAMDVVFSVDSVLTAVGLSEQLPIMVAAIVISVVVMLVFAGTISRFIAKHPTTKVLALSFLLLIGVLLVADGLGHHVPRGYVYFALGFSVLVEAANIRMRVKRSIAQTAPAEAQ
jgi:predicted tellurium resistance membrane protein TerC